MTHIFPIPFVFTISFNNGNGSASNNSISNINEIIETLLNFKTQVNVFVVIHLMLIFLISINAQLMSLTSATLVLHHLFEPNLNNISLNDNIVPLRNTIIYIINIQMYHIAKQHQSCTCYSFTIISRGCIQ